MVYNVIIIGAGNVGAFFDRPGSDNILTHAHAFSVHRGFNLVGFIDVNMEKARMAAELWKCDSFKDLDEAFNAEKIDVVCCAVPDEHHYQILKDLSSYSLKAVLAEKPLTKTLEEADSIVKIYSKMNAGVFVNYSRRFVPEFEILKEEIQSGIYGLYQTGSGYYGKGIIHNGSHLLDLLRYLIGDIDGIKHVSNVADFYPDDESVSAVLTFRDGKPFFLQHVDCSKYTIFEIDLLFERKRICICDSGFRIEVYDVHESPYFKGYMNLIKTTEINTALNNSMYHLADNIYQYISHGQQIKCGIEDGYMSLKMAVQIRESVPHD